MRIYRVVAVSAMTMFAVCVQADPALEIPLATNLQQDARTAAEKHVPLVILFSLPNCPHCDAVRRSHLIPLQQSPASPRKPILRQIEANGQMPLLGIDGVPTTHSEFARRYAIKFTPQVMFLDEHGKQLAAPLIGSMLPDFYGAYLENALQDSLARLGNPERGKSGS